MCYGPRVSDAGAPTERQTLEQAGSQTVPRIELTVVCEAGKPADRSVVVEGPVVRIGAHASNDVVLADAAVSGFHCRLTEFNGRWRVTDSGSTNGTRVAGVPARDADLVFPTCSLEIGQSVVRVQERQPGHSEELSGALTCGGLVGLSTRMRRLFHQIRNVGKSDSTVLIEGETGTGKELVAAELVRRGKRARKPMVVVDCGALAPTLIESQLFGHVRGAFTGADATRVGAFEHADGGTLFLDEIGELPLEAQPKLLRAIEQREIRRLGEQQLRSVDVRVVAATNRQLENEVNAGRFREDLYFRLSVITIRVPPLREHPEDIPLLVDHFLDALGAMQRRDLFTPDVLAAMAARPWPGNVRELRNFIERRVVVDDSDAWREPRGGGGVGDYLPVDLAVPYKTAKDALVTAFEKRYFAQLLAWAEGNVSKAARKAGLDRMWVYRMMQRHGLGAGADTDDDPDAANGAAGA
jgi:transcriptional regulator with GAF, ATPase, and Fis domain